jgi:hypothetical protein
MLLVVIERFKHDDPMPVWERCLRFGRMLPEGLVYLASWVDSEGGLCFQVMETPQPDLLKSWMTSWADLIDFEIIPIETTSAFWANQCRAEALDAENWPRL